MMTPLVVLSRFPRTLGKRGATYSGLPMKWRCVGAQRGSNNAGGLAMLAMEGFSNHNEGGGAALLIVVTAMKVQHSVCALKAGPA